MKNIDTLPSTPTIDILTNLALLYHDNQLTPTDLSAIKAKYPIGTVVTMNGVQYYLSNYEEGKSYPGVDPNNVPLFIFTTVYSMED